MDSAGCIYVTIKKEEVRNSRGHGGRDKRGNDVNTIVIMKFSKFLNKQINTEKNK